MKMKLLVYIFVSLVAGAITLQGCASDVDNAPEPIVRLDKAISGYHALDAAEQLGLLDSLRPEFDAYFKVMRMADATPAGVLMLSESDVVTAFQPDVDSVFPNLDATERQLGHMLAVAASDSLAIAPMRYAAVVWGFSQSIVRVDSVMLIALNHYLGADYPGYSHWEAYQRSVKTPEMLPYNLAEAIVSTQYPMEGADDATLLSRMLYDGAVVYACMRMVPHADLAKAMGYTDVEMEFMEANTEQLWQEMAMRKMVYTTDPTMISSMMLPGPFSPLMQGDVPGRAGRYIGYKIVDAYVRSHKHASLRLLLSPHFYNNNQTLINSGF